MRRITFVFRIVVAVLMLGILTGGHTSAQPQQFEPGSYTSVLTGLTVEVSGPEFEITDAELQHYFTGDGEVLDISGVSTSASLEVSFFGDFDTPADSIEAYFSSVDGLATPGSLEVLDEGVHGSVFYKLVLFDYEGVDILYYIQVTEDIVGDVDLLEGYLSLPGDASEALAEAQAEVTIDGVPFMHEVDPDRLAEVAEHGGTLFDTDVSGGTTATQSSSRITLPASGAVISLGRDFAVVDEPVTGDEIETAYIESSTVWGMINVGSTGMDAVDVADEFVGGFIGTSADVTIVMDEASFDGSSILRVLKLQTGAGFNTYVIVTVDTQRISGYEVVEVYRVPADNVRSSIRSIQDQVTLNGEQALLGVDADAVILALAEAPDTNKPDTPETDRANPRDGARIPVVVPTETPEESN